MDWKLLACDCCVIRGAGLKELQHLKRKDAVSLAPSPACAGLSAGSIQLTPGSSLASRDWGALVSHMGTPAWLLSRVQYHLSAGSAAF